MEVIRESTLRELAQAQMIERVRLLGQEGGYVIRAQCGQIYRTLCSSRGEVRVFTLESASNLLRDIGIPRFEVDAERYQRGRIRKPRPDRAEALRKTRTRPRQATLSIS